MAKTLAKFRIVVRDGKEARVRPASDLIEKKVGSDPPQAITFVNKTKDFARVRLPGKVFVGEAKPFVINLAAKGSAGDQQTLNVDGAVDGLFTFKVFCDETFDFAEGHSDPEFIIEN